MPQAFDGFNIRRMLTFGDTVLVEVLVRFQQYTDTRQVAQAMGVTPQVAAATA
jgi:hypothetical protein